MKVFANIAFKGRYPVGTSAIIIAESEKHAVELLSDELFRRGLDQNIPIREADMIEIDVVNPMASILNDGDY